MLKTNEEIKAWVDNAHLIRGLVIAEFCRLETNIVYTMIDFFSKEDEVRTNLMEVVFDRLTFEDKRASLNKMLQREEDKTITNKKHGYSALMTEIQNLIKIRNQFAHYPLIEFIDPYENSVICLTKYRDGTKQIDFSQQQIDEIIERIRKASHSIFCINI